MELNCKISTEKMARLLNVRSRRRVLIYLIIILLTSYCFTLIVRMRCTDVYRNTSKRISRFVFNIPDDVSCYSYLNGSTDELKFIKSNAIYMISASCEDYLSAHQACVIESVLQAHGYQKHVYVFFTRPVKECMCSVGLINGLTGISQLHFITIQIDKFVEDTPLKGVFGDKFLNIGMDREARVVEFLKYAALYKFRGIVIDLNMILAKPVYYLGMNWVARISESRLGTAAMALNKNMPIGKKLLTTAITLLKEQRYFEKIDGGHSLADAFRVLCYERPVEGCPSFKMYDANLFYPFDEKNSNMIFREGDLAAKTYGYYVWDRTEARIRTGSVYHKLMREYCPNIAGFMNV